MIKSLFKSFLLAFLIIITCGNVNAKKKEIITDINIPLIVDANGISRRFSNLDYGIRIQVRNESDSRFVVLNDLPSKDAEKFPRVELTNSLVSSTEQNLNQIASRLGFNVSADFSTDYILSVTIQEFRLRVRDYDVKRKRFRSSAAVIMSWELLNADRDVVISSSTVTGHGQADSQRAIAQPLQVAYLQALDGIDWDRIAPKLKVAKSAHQEKNKQVTGKGDTALESTVIRWYIVSKPQGADVTWRVVSSTPDVPNTNANYIGTTPFESTETFDIKGLTYNNSGNVQIEVSCERNGYITQRKRFNLRQVIDQKEISTKFNLVKEDEEEE